MPLYVYDILGPDGLPSGETIEEIFKASEVPDQLKGALTGAIAIRRRVNLIARTPDKWGAGGTGKWGINGFFDRGLGVRYNSYEERDAICKARGVVPLDDMPKYYLEDHNEKAMKYEKYLDDRADAYWEGAKACKDIKDQERFWEEYCPAKPALDGEYTKTIDDF
jgi:hypothetical protein|tara:strand:+ start:2753 stop:3247 length:495 start_codon:yes stop_codon:yes gene_type:complete